MPAELRDALHRAAALPRRPLDLAHLLTRSRRRRRKRIGAVAGSLLLAGAVAVVAVPRAGLDDPRPLPTAPAASPVPFASLPPGWTMLPAPPEVRHRAATAWTGEQLLIWGGTAPAYTDAPEDTGFGFDTRTGTWHELPRSPLSPRTRPASAWTGAELLVWGGVRGGDGTAGPLDDGAAYDPRRGTWRPLPPAPISPRAPLSVWTGEELIVWGTAVRAPAGVPADGAAYRPATDSWRAIASAPVALTDAVAAWTGREMIVFGARLDGRNAATTRTAVGAAYDPRADRWRRLPDPDLSPQASTASWNGRELVAADYLGAAAAYDPTVDRWRSLPEVPLRPGECAPTSAPVGADVLVDLCVGTVLYVAGDGGWRDVSQDRYAGWWWELLPAGPVVVALGREVPGGAEAVLAFRPPG